MHNKKVVHLVYSSKLKIYTSTNGYYSYTKRFTAYCKQITDKELNYYG